MYSIEINNLCKSYKDFSLDNINLKLPEGCIMGLIGENGAGKSTTIKILLNMIRADSGSVNIFGMDNTKEDINIKEDIGFVLDEVSFNECFNAIEIGKIMSNFYKNWDSDIYKKHLLDMKLPNNKKFKELSKGMKMKLGIAVALSHRPRLLILDEATSGIDPLARDEIIEIFNEFTRDEKNSILISSHIISDLEKICDYIAFLHEGRLMLCEGKDRLKDMYGIIHCSKKDIEAIDNSSILHKKETPYGVEAMVLRESIPSNIEVFSADIEQIFIYMAKNKEGLY